MSRIKNLNKKKKITRKNKRKSHKFTRRKKGGSQDAGFAKVDEAEIYIVRDGNKSKVILLKDINKCDWSKVNLQKDLKKHGWETEDEKFIVEQVSKGNGSDPDFQFRSSTNKKSEEIDYKLMVKTDEKFYPIYVECGFDSHSYYIIKNGDDNKLGVYKKDEKKPETTPETTVKEESSESKKREIKEVLKKKLDEASDGNNKVNSKGDVCDQIIRFFQPNGTFDNLLKDDDMSKRFSGDIQIEEAWKVYFVEFLEGLKQVASVNTDDGIFSRLKSDFGDWSKIKKDIEQPKRDTSASEQEGLESRAKALLQNLNPFAGGSLEQSTLSLDNSQDFKKKYLQELEQMSQKSMEDRENLETIKDILTPHNPDNNFHLSAFKEFRKDLVSSDDQHMALLLDTLTDPNLNTNYSLSNKYAQDLKGGAPEEREGRVAKVVNSIASVPKAIVNYIYGNKNEWIYLPDGNLRKFLAPEIEMKFFNYPLSLIQLDALFRTNDGNGWKDDKEQLRIINTLDSIEGEEKISPSVRARDSLFKDIDNLWNNTYSNEEIENWTQEPFSRYYQKKKLEFGNGPGFTKSKVLGYLRNNNHKKYLSFLELFQRKSSHKGGLLLLQENSPNILLFSDPKQSYGFRTFVYFDNQNYYLAQLYNGDQLFSYFSMTRNDELSNPVKELMDSLNEVSKREYISEEQLKKEEVELTVTFFKNVDGNFQKLVSEFTDIPEKDLKTYLKENTGSVLKNLQSDNDIDIINKSIEQHITQVNIGAGSSGGSGGDDLTSGPILKYKSRFDLFTKTLEILNKIQKCLTDIKKPERGIFFTEVTELFEAQGVVNNLIEFRKRFEQIQQELEQIEKNTKEIILLRFLFNEQLDILKHFNSAKKDFEERLYEIKKQFLSNTPQLKQFEDESPITPLPLTSEKESELAKIFDELHAEFMSLGSEMEIEKKLLELDSKEAIQQITTPISESDKKSESTPTSQLGAATSKIMSFIYVVIKFILFRKGLGFAKIFLPWKIFLGLLFLLITGLIPKDNIQGIKKALIAFLKILCYAPRFISNVWSWGKEEGSDSTSNRTNTLSRGDEDLSNMSSLQPTPSSRNNSIKPTSSYSNQSRGAYSHIKKKQKK